MASVKDIYYLAGLLEGEGCFHLGINKRKCPSMKYKSGIRLSITPRVIFASTDKDIMMRVKNMLNGTTSSTQRKSPDKAYHTTTIFGSHAISWMMTLYPLMGIRRKAKIREILVSWKLDYSDLRSQL